MKNYRAAERILTLKTPPKTKQNTDAWGILIVLCFCFCFEEKKKYTRNIDSIREAKQALRF